MDLQLLEHDRYDCVWIQIARELDGFRVGQAVEVAGKRGTLLTFRCDGPGIPAAWVQFKVGPALMDIKLPLSELRGVE